MNTESFRCYFPQFKDIIHFASCSLAARSTAMTYAMNNMLDDMSGNILGWHNFEKEIFALKNNVAKFIGASAEQIAIMPNASVAAYQIASTLNWKEKAEIVLSDEEFPSIAHIWLAQKRNGASCHFVKGSQDANEIINAYINKISIKTKLVSIPYTSYLDGKTFPIKEISEHATSVGAKIFVDAYQAIGVEPINVKLLNCDYLIAGTMKYLLGLPGLAFLYIKSGVENDLHPQLTGWFGRKDPFSFDPQVLDFPKEASRFETGTPSVPAVYAANAGLNLLLKLDINVIKKHVSSLVDYAYKKLKRG
ncbi:MAG: aminotransferase class V-fold PLP-dependent enzyme, partial [Alcanivoracaceae bacterium]|nr:aminotransferase class V-fold PLP-dependent enzyme [Alcanivoracaceae bacterium]